MKPLQWYKLWSSSVEKKVVDLKMNMLWQGSSVWGCIIRDTCSGKGEVCAL